MAYSTPLLVRQALSPRDWLADPSPDPQNPTNTAADLSDAQLADAIAEADALVDSYLSVYFTTPVALDGATLLPPHPVDYWSRNIAAYSATLTYRGSQDFSPDDPIARRYAMTMSALLLVSQGKMNLPLPPSSGLAVAQGAGTPFNPYSGTLFDAEDFSLAPAGASWGHFGRPRWDNSEW